MGGVSIWLVNVLYKSKNSGSASYNFNITDTSVFTTSDYEMVYTTAGGNTFIFFFSSRRRHTRLQGDWSSACALPIWISPVQALLYTAILYGLTAPVMIVLLLHI